MCAFKRSRRESPCPRICRRASTSKELEAGSRPIEGVGTAVAAFVGLAEKGPFNTPTLVTNWSQFVQTYGEFVEGTYLALSVFGYFQNGGGAAYIVRIGAGGASGAGGR